VKAGPVPAHLEALARRAVEACPVLALRVASMTAVNPKR
jgi:ferredoxin